MSAISIFLVSLLAAQMARAGINFATANPFTVSPRPELLAVGDLNGDRNDDVVVISPQSDEVQILLGSSTDATRFSPGSTIRFGKTLRTPTLGDLNGDGRLDLVVADEGAMGVWVLLGRGDGTFSPPDLLNVGRNPYAVAVGNFTQRNYVSNGRPINDLAIADRRQNRVYVRLNDAQNPPRFTSGPEVTTGLEPEAIFAIDTNSDGKLDLVTIDLGGPRVKDVGVLLFQRVTAGFPVFAPVRQFLLGEKPESFGVADFNDDGNQDLYMLNRPSGTGNSDMDVSLSDGNGQFLPRLTFEVPCPFFTGGLFCRARSVAAADFDGDGHQDLTILLTDPRRFSQSDAMQIFAGRGDGGFVSGGVFSVPKAPLVAATGDFTGDGPIDIAVSSNRDLHLQAFVNVSTPGDAPNGTACLFGEECSSSRCIDGYCCGTICEGNERCDVPSREGTCQRVDTPVACSVPGDCSSVCRDDPTLTCVGDSDCGNNGDCVSRFCVDGFCCDETCPSPGRCDVFGFEGLCLERLEDGLSCEFDDDCASGFCRDGFCCKDDCANGRCNDQGICTSQLPDGTVCQFDDECSSSVCDVFNGICCERVCDAETEDCNDQGMCVPFGSMATSTPVSGTPTPTPEPKAPGDLCASGAECDTTFCVNNVCCFVDMCEDGFHCEAGLGNCVFGTPPPLPTATPTPSAPTGSATPGGNATSTPTMTSGTGGTATPVPTATADLCGGNCPDGQRCNDQGQCVPINPCEGRCSIDNCIDGTCIFTSRSGGCSTTGSQPARPIDLLVLLLLPGLLWGARRSRGLLHRVRARPKR